METLSFILSVGSLLSFMLSAFLKGKSMRLILVLNVMGNLLLSASYFCTGMTSGALLCLIGGIMSLVNFFFDAKQIKIPVWLLVVYAVIFVAANLLTFSHWADILTLIAALVFVMLISSPNGKMYRIWMLASNVLWCLYDIFRGNWGPLVSHVILTGSTVLGMIKNDRNQKEA